MKGDKRGPRNAVYDLCHPRSPQDARPFQHLRATHAERKPYEIEYMRHTGAFQPLRQDVCDDLVRCYFEHVHFFLPVVNAPEFLNEYEQSGCQQVSPLLCWSMFLAAANVSLRGNPPSRTQPELCNLI